MIHAAARKQSCRFCRYWAPNLRGETALEGVCRVLIQDPSYYGSLVTKANYQCDQWAALGEYEDEAGETKEDRRIAMRSRINLAACLRTANSVQSAWLADISEKGAGINMRDPPVEGARAVLKWKNYEVFGTIVWANEGACGLMFDAPISREVVFETIREGALKNDRSADTSRIVLGHKRKNLV